MLGKLVGFLLVMGLMPSVWANVDSVDVSAEQSKVAELELENDVEELEAFGEAATAEATKQETKELDQEAKRLEKEIASYQRQNARSKDKIKNLNKKFVIKERQARLAQIRFKKVDGERRRLESKVQKLASQVEKKESKAIALIDQSKAAEQEIRRLKATERDLIRRDRLAKRTIENKRRSLKKMGGEARRISKRIAAFDN